MTRLLEIHHLETQFFTRSGVVHAVNDVSFHVDAGETIGIVGESDSGKSITMLSVMRLIPSPPGKIVGGEVRLEGEDLLKLSDRQIRQICGNQMAMIFQDPMTSLNPVLRIEKQNHRGDRASSRLEFHAGEKQGDRTVANSWHSRRGRAHPQLSASVRKLISSFRKLRR